MRRLSLKTYVQKVRFFVGGAPNTTAEHRGWVSKENKKDHIIFNPPYQQGSTNLFKNSKFWNLLPWDKNGLTILYELASMDGGKVGQVQSRFD